MSKNTPVANLPIRDLLNHLEHRIRELHEHYSLDVLQAVDGLHQLTRPKRRKSAFPSIRNVSNGYERWAKAIRYGDRMAASIEECLRAMESRVDEIVAA